MNFSKRSTAARTKMLTVCKGCKQSNGNGYQYCTACHKEHRNTKRKMMVPQPSNGRLEESVSSAVTPNDVLEVLGEDGPL
jgi:recombinational DNA repair protein RecR